MWCNGEFQNYFLGPVGTSQETGDHADQAKGLLEEDGEFGDLTYSQ